jgi:hypothetical protein
MSSPTTPPAATSTRSSGGKARSRKLRISGRIKLAILAVLLLVALGFAAKPAYRAYRDGKLDQNLEAAREAARLEDWTTARDKARSVLMVRGDDFEAFRIWSRALAETGEPRAYMSATQRFVDPRATDEDKLETLRVLALQAPQALTLGAFGSLSEENRNRPDFRAAITPLLILRGQAELAEKGLREVMGADPSPAVSLELIRTICARPDAARLEEAREHFARLIARDAGREGLEALLLLGNTPGGLAPGDPLPPELQAWVGRQPKAKTIHHLVSLHPTLDAAPDAADRVFREAIERYSDTDPAELGTWLVRHNRSEEALKMLEEPAKTRSDAFIARLHALLRLERDDDIKAALLEPPPSADPVEVEMIRAVTAGRRGDTNAASAAWTRALNEAAFDTRRNRFLEIARTAEAQGARSAAEDAWVGAFRSGWGQLPLYADVIPLITSLGGQSRSEDMLAIFRTMVRLEPGNPDLLNNYLYLGLIHRITTPAEAASRLADLAQKHPEMSELNSALMLAEMMDARPGDALARLPKLQESQRVPPTVKEALEVTARVLTGEIDSGSKILADVPWDGFMKQEQVIFRDLLALDPKVELPQSLTRQPAEQIDPEQVPAWRKAIEKMEQDRAGDILPALPPPRLPGAEAAAQE